LRKLTTLPPHRLPRIIIFASPQCLAARDSDISKIWSALFVDLAVSGILKLLVVDEAHLHILQGLTFRSEFLRLKSAIFDPLRQHQCKTSILYMTATFSPKWINLVKKRWGVEFAKTIWASPKDMARRNVELTFTVRSLFGKVLKSHLTLLWNPQQLAPHKPASPPKKAIVYTNKKSDIDSLTDQAFEVCETCFGDDHGMLPVPMHGDLSIQDKCVNTKLFCGEVNDPLASRTISLIATASSADVGIDCPSCVLIVRKGMPPSLTSLAQEMGRLRSDGEYSLVLSLADFAYQLQRSKESKASDMLLQDLMEALVALVLSPVCLHRALESRFGKSGGSSVLSETCNNMCPVCSGARAKVALPVDHAVLSSFLCSLLLSDAKPLDPGAKGNISSTISKDKQACKRIFKRSDYNKYNIEFLILQLIAAGVLQIKHKPLSANDKETAVHVCLAQDESGQKLTLADDKHWDDILVFPAQT